MLFLPYLLLVFFREPFACRLLVSMLTSWLSYKVRVFTENQMPSCLTSFSSFKIQDVVMIIQSSLYIVLKTCGHFFILFFFFFVIVFLSNFCCIYTILILHNFHYGFLALFMTFSYKYWRHIFFFYLYLFHHHHSTGLYRNHNWKVLCWCHCWLIFSFFSYSVNIILIFIVIIPLELKSMMTEILLWFFFFSLN